MSFSAYNSTVWKNGNELPYRDYEMINNLSYHAKLGSDKIIVGIYKLRIVVYRNGKIVENLHNYLTNDCMKYHDYRKGSEINVEYFESKNMPYKILISNQTIEVRHLNGAQYVRFIENCYSSSIWHAVSCCGDVNLNHVIQLKKIFPFS